MIDGFNGMSTHLGHVMPKQTMSKTMENCFFVCLCFTSLQQRGHLETTPPFTVPFVGRETR